MKLYVMSFFAICMLTVSFIIYYGNIKEEVVREENVKFKNVKVVYVNSYYKAYVWNYRIFNALLQNLSITQNSNSIIGDSQTPIDFSYFTMNSRFEKSKDCLEAKMEIIKRTIDSIQPDIILTRDDNVVKYLIENSSLYLPIQQSRS